MVGFDSRPDDRSAARHAGFATTRWSLVLKLKQGRSSQARSALTALCQLYWFPLYAHVRRTGYQRAEAEDLTQEFFARLLEREDWRRVTPERGRFRSFLLAAFKHFLANQWDKARALKRGGGRRLLSLDFDSAENRYQQLAAQSRTPDQLFERQWALTLLDRVRSALRQEYVEAGKADLFDRLQSHLAGELSAVRYGEVARELAMTEGAVKVAVHRLRRRFRDRLRNEIAETVTSPEEIDQEIRDLFAALRA